MTQNSENQPYVIEFDGLEKRYGEKRVLKGISGSVSSGQLVGFLGPNGAGKSTTIRAILGLIKPTSGLIQVFGKDIRAAGPKIRQQVGYLPGEVNLYRNLTGKQFLEHFSRIRRIECRKRYCDLADRLELDLRTLIRKFSSGMKQKLCLIQALMHSPNLLILDEPTSALDPLVKKTVFEMLKEEHQHGRTILFSSHSLHEVEELCDQVIIMRSGEIVAKQSIESLRENSMGRFEVEFRSAIPKTLPDGMITSAQNGLILSGTFSGDPAIFVEWLSSQSIKSFEFKKAELEDLFLQYYRSGDSKSTIDHSESAEDGK